MRPPRVTSVVCLITERQTPFRRRKKTGDGHETHRKKNDLLQKFPAAQQKTHQGWQKQIEEKEQAVFYYFFCFQSASAYENRLYSQSGNFLSCRFRKFKKALFFQNSLSQTRIEEISGPSVQRRVLRCRKNPACYKSFTMRLKLCYK